MYQWLEAAPERGLVGLTDAVKDELAFAVILMPFAAANIRWPMDTELSCADATPCAAGAVSAVVPDLMAAALYRIAEHRGEYVRLDWDGLQEQLEPSAMARPLKEINQLVSCLPWRLHDSTFSGIRRMSTLRKRGPSKESSGTGSGSQLSVHVSRQAGQLHFRVCVRSISRTLVLALGRGPRDAAAQFNFVIC